VLQQSLVNGMSLSSMKQPKRAIDKVNESVITKVSVLSLLSSMILPSVSLAKMETIIGSYKDEQAGYTVTILPGWTSIRKSTPTPTMEKYQEEEVLFTSTNFVEGIIIITIIIITTITIIIIIVIITIIIIIIITIYHHH